MFLVFAHQEDSILNSPKPIGHNFENFDKTFLKTALMTSKENEKKEVF